MFQRRGDCPGSLQPPPLEPAPLLEKGPDLDMAYRSKLRSACAVLALVPLATLRSADAGTVSGRVAVGATVVSSCAWRTQVVPDATTPGRGVPAVVSRCSAGVNYAASIHADPALAQAVRMERRAAPGADALVPVRTSPALHRDDTAVPVQLPAWGDLRPTYITIIY